MGREVPFLGSGVQKNNLYRPGGPLASSHGHERAKLGQNCKGKRCCCAKIWKNWPPTSFSENCWQGHPPIDAPTLAPPIDKHVVQVQTPSCRCLPVTAGVNTPRKGKNLMECLASLEAGAARPASGPPKNLKIGQNECQNDLKNRPKKAKMG